MENTKITRSWGVAVVIVAAVVCIAAAALTFTNLARAQQTQPCCPTVVTHWLPQPILEAKFRDRIITDNRNILERLQALADKPVSPGTNLAGLFKGTYLENPRLWTQKGWAEEWSEISAELINIFAKGGHPVITSITVLIEYQPTLNKPPADDIDAVAKIRITFSASPDGHTIEGTLKHSRVCEII